MLYDHRWVRTVRDQKKFSFIEVNDGSSLGGIQAVAESGIESYGEVVTHPHTEKTSFGDPHRFGEYCGGNLSNWVEYSELNESCCDEAIS